MAKGSSILKKYGPNRSILFSALLLFLTFEPLHLWPLAGLALVPWFLFLEKAETRGEAVKQSLWLCFLFSVITFSWVAYVIHQFGEIPWPLAIIALLLFGLIAQPQFYLGALPLRFLLRKVAGTGSEVGKVSLITCPWAILGLGLTVALFYSGLDWTLPKLFVDTLGHSLFYAPTLKQCADIGGPGFLTFLLLLVNASVFTLYTRLRNRGEPAVWGALRTALPLAVFSGAVLIAAHFYGSYRIDQVADRIAHPKKKIVTAAIQANIGDIEKLASEKGYRQASERVMRAYYDLSDEALKLTPKPQVLLWPETAYPSTFRTPETSDDFARDKNMESWVADRKTPIVFGGYDRDMRGLSYNAVFYLWPDGAEMRDTRYTKTILIPFGEYIPGLDSFPQIRKLFPMVGFFGTGPGSVIREIAGMKTQPVICYEVLFPYFTRDAVKQGAEVILNFTNDSWFGPVGAPYYHLNLASFRSIETRVSQIRSTNTGFSALILPDGSIPHRTKLYEPEIMNVEVPIIEPIPTLMLALGDWFGKTALTLSLLVLGFLRWPTRSLFLRIFARNNPL